MTTLLPLLWLSLAASGATLGELEAEAGGTPFVALQCERAGDLEGWVRDDPVTRAFAWLPADQVPALRSDVDEDAPIRVVVVALEGGTRRTIADIGVRDPEAMQALIDDTEGSWTIGGAELDLATGLVAEPDPETDPGAASPRRELALRGDRLHVLAEDPAPAYPSGLALIDAVESRAGERSCVLAVDLMGVIGTLPIALPVTVGLVTMTFDSPEEDFDLYAQVEDLPEGLAALLDGEGDPGLAAIRATSEYPIALQIHGTVPEVLQGLAKVLPGAQGLSLAVAAESIPGWIRTGRGVIAASGGPSSGGMLAIPMERPHRIGALRRMVKGLARQMDATAERTSRRTLAVTPAGKPPLAVGLAPGLIIAALDPIVVEDILEERGEPLLPPVTSPYGIRLVLSTPQTRIAGATLPGIQGYFEFLLDGDLLHIAAIREPTR